ncbi:MAG: hypothetical protein BWX81_01241 [Spirochaetes bacterium ADurb.Bin110]|nr:MAG: hypothetical protein BWX81_01241 [Spirochaetes bacterium ADurb.Bin110]
MNRKISYTTIFAIIIAVLLVLLCFVFYYPTGKKESPPMGYAPLRDDGLAAHFQPVFDCPSEFGLILAVYYRAAIDDSGIIHIAYHPAWERERNNAKGIGPFLSRILYTGGLSLQSLMFGPGDIEAIAFAIDPVGWKIVEIYYETAADYDPSAFSVKHEAVSLTGSFVLPIRFKVISWNHLFELEERVASQDESFVAPAALIGSIMPPSTEAPDKVIDSAIAPAEAIASTAAPATPTVSSNSMPEAPLSYFSPELWDKYGIWKNPETILRKNRAHFIWERGVAP